MRTFLLRIFLLLFTLRMTACYAQSESLPEKINWISFEQLSDSLQQKPKKVFLSFYTDWCRYCHKMHREVLTDPQIAQLINQQYYAVRFDAESIDSIYFDGQLLVAKNNLKKTGKYHPMAMLLASRKNKLVFPTTVILDENFAITKRSFELLNKSDLIKLIK